MRQAVGVLGCLVALLSASPPANADGPDNPGGVGIGLSVGTTGVGGEVSVRPIGNLVLRAGGGWFSLNHDFTVDNNAFKLKTDLVSVGGTLDWHPFTNGFRLSAGGRYHNFDLSGSTNMMASYTIGDHVYAAAQIGKLNATVNSANTVAPYLGLGYDSTHFSDSRWALALDLGAIYGGKPSSTITATNSGLIPGLQSDLDKEQKKLDDVIGKYGQFWPVVNLTLKYRF